MEKGGTGDASQSSQMTSKPRRQLCMKKPDSQKSTQSQRDPLRWIRKEKASSSQSISVKAEPPPTPRKIKKEEKAIVIDLCSDEEEDGLDTNLGQWNEAGSSRQKSVPGVLPDVSRQDPQPANTMNALQEVPKETFGLQPVDDAHTAHTETAFGQDFLSQNGLASYAIEEWQNGLIREDEQENNQGLTDQDGMQELNSDLFSMQMDSPPAPFRIHDSSTSIEAETPNTTSSVRAFRSAHPEQGDSGVDVRALSSDADHFLRAPAQQEGPSQPHEQANVTAPSQEQNADMEKLFQMLFQHGQQNLVPFNNRTANPHLYIAEMTVDPISEKQLGKRKAADLPRASRLPVVLTAQKLPEVPAVTDEDEDGEENPFAGIPHYPTALPTMCHYCKEMNHELKMRCRVHKRGKVCGLYFCKACCLVLGNEDFQPYLEMYSCARCNKSCDCKSCKKSRRRDSRASSKKASSSNPKRKPGQGNKTLTQTYYDSVRTVTARKKISQLQAMAINSSSPLSSVGEDEEDLPSDMEESPTGSPWREQARNDLTDAFAQFNHQSMWGKTANRRHLSEGSDEGIRRYNESSDSEDGRPTPSSSSVASIRASIPAIAQYNNHD